MEKEFKKPKYKIGDLIVYRDRYREKHDLLKVMQGIIIEAYALLDVEDKDDKLSWYYDTKQIIDDEEDPLDDNDILYKITN